MDFHFLFRISIVAFCFDCTLIAAAHPKVEALVNNGKKSSLQAVLEEMGYSMNDLESMPKSAVVGLLGEISTRYENLKNDQKEWVSKAEMEERLAWYGLHEGAIAVGEAQDLMYSDKKPEPIPDANVDNANARAVHSRHKRAHPYGFTGKFDPEFDILINGVRGIIHGYEYYRDHGKIDVAEKMFDPQAYYKLLNSSDFA